MRSFYKLLAVGLLTATTNNFVWFALTYWAYLTTNSVIATSTLAGIWLVLAAVSGIWLGAIVDHNKKKNAMLGSSVASLIFFTGGYYFLTANNADMFTKVESPILWIFVLILLVGTTAGNIYAVAIPTLVAIIVPEKMRDRANGMFGTVMGVSFAITSVASGLVLGYGGMQTVLIIAVVATILAIILLSGVSINETSITRGGEELRKENSENKVDIRGTIAAVRKVPGLFGLIFFTTINNFLGGVFMALMDAYGLTLVSVQTWGLLWGFLSFGFIFGGLYISKKGLGINPLNTLFHINIVLWTVCIFFTIQSSIVLLALGMFIWLSLVPFVEATEQTIMQKVVPPERLGRVFGFAHSIEQAASPITAFFIGPIAQMFFIPFMTQGVGADLIGGWFGTGTGRGIALVFIVAGLIGLSITLFAKKSRSFILLSKAYKNT